MIPWTGGRNKSRGGKAIRIVERRIQEMNKMQRGKEPEMSIAQ